MNNVRAISTSINSYNIIIKSENGKEEKISFQGATDFLLCLIIILRPDAIYLLL